MIRSHILSPRNRIRSSTFRWWLLSLVGADIFFHSDAPITSEVWQGLLEGWFEPFLKQRLYGHLCMGEEWLEPGEAKVICSLMYGVSVSLVYIYFTCNFVESNVLPWGKCFSLNFFGGLVFVLWQIRCIETQYRFLIGSVQSCNYRGRPLARWTIWWIPCVFVIVYEFSQYRTKFPTFSKWISNQIVLNTHSALNHVLHCRLVKNLIVAKYCKLLYPCAYRNLHTYLEC